MTASVVPASSAHEAYRIIDPGGASRWLRAGWEDFLAMPGLSLAYGAVFAIGGWLMFFLMMSTNLTFLMLPLASGFLLVSPVFAVGLYDSSRRRQKGETPTLATAFAAWKRCPNRLAIAAAGLFMLLWVWLNLSFILFLGIMSQSNISVDGFIAEVFRSSQGQFFLIAETVLGGVFAVIAFATTVVSIPMFVDRNTGVFTAVTTSIKLCLDNRTAMIGWGVIIAILMLISTATFFILHAAILPILAYASWHAYKDLVAPASGESSPH